MSPLLCFQSCSLTELRAADQQPKPSNDDVLNCTLYISTRVIFGSSHQIFGFIISRLPIIHSFFHLHLRPIISLIEQLIAIPLCHMHNGISLEACQEVIDRRDLGRKEGGWGGAYPLLPPPRPALSYRCLQFNYSTHATS